MKYSYKFWSIVLTPIDRFFNLFNYYIVFTYDENDDVFDKFESMKVVHYSKL